MMTNKNNKKYGFLKYSLGVVIAIALTLTFACEKTDTLLSAENDVQYVYDGQLVSLDEVNTLNINYYTSDEIDKLEVITAYPNLSTKLKEGRYKLLFDQQNKDHQQTMAKLEIEIIDFKVNNEALLPKIQNVTNEDVFIMVEEMPQYPGGEETLRKFIANNVKYPVAATDSSIQGKVFVAFVVEKDGSIGRARIARGVEPSLDEEALRVVNSLPTWIPGKQRGQNVAVSFTIPINFQLQ